MYSFNGIPVILSEHMTEYIVKKVYRNYRPGQRRGRNKSLRKLAYIKSLVVPNNKDLCARCMFSSTLIEHGIELKGT